MYFQLPKDIYIGKWGDSIIILDAKNDKYLSITDEAVDCFTTALSSEFNLNDGLYLPAQKIEGDHELHANMIAHFIESGFIEVAKSNSNIHINTPLKTGGLADYEWAYKSSFAPFSKTPKGKLLKAWLTLFKVHRLLKKQGIKGILDALKKEAATSKEYKIPSQEEIQALSDCIDLASVLYVKKVYCLGWAATFVLEALKRGWKCTMAIGVQGIPFYAHAWAECEGEIINDESIVQEYLTTLLKEPFE